MTTATPAAATSSVPVLTAARRLLFLAAVAFWLGGITFYGGVVIPSGVKVLGSSVAQGFVTQEVTGWLNVAGAVALPIILWNAIAVGRLRSPKVRWLVYGTWLVMAGIEVQLFVMHPYLDQLLNPSTQEILDPHRFHTLHQVYLISSTIQWCVALLHLATVVTGPM